MLKTNRRSKGLLLLLGSLVALALGCTPSDPQSTFGTIGPVARDQAMVFWIIFALGVVVFVLVEGAILYMVIKFRRKPGDGDPEQVHGNTQIEIVWTVIPAIILIIAVIPTLIVVFSSANSPQTPEEGGLLVEAIGHQWWFEFKYPEYGVVTANELHIPVDEVVNFKLGSVDVIHSFWFPKAAGKVDMVPGNDNTVWFLVEREGEFFGQCVEFCGVAHANMQMKLVVESQEDFDAWIAAQLADASVPTDPLALEGQELFMGGDTLCFRCHTVGGTRLARGNIGPNLTHVASRRHLASGLLKNTEDGSEVVSNALLQANLREWLKDPDKVKPGNIMGRDAEVYNGTIPALTDNQIDALVAYLLTLK
ncbi:MAG: cytochrome c oxidase subunit II [Chloroflexi bacterium]|nr:cytochrome c oxidase subunit II [Chloroflexota bacterium]